MLRKATFWGFASAGLLSVGLLGACSGKSSGNAPIAQADFSSQYAQAICDSIKDCCAQGGNAYDANACNSAVHKELDPELTKMGTTAAHYDANAAGDCVAAVRTAASNCSSTNESTRPVNDACSRIFSGTKALGETCANAADCAPSSQGQVTCYQWSSVGTGPSGDGGVGSSSGSRCMLIRAAQKGDACSFHGSGTPPTVMGDCADSRTSSLYCDYDSGTCQPKVAIGQPCTAFGLSGCVTGAVCTQGTCQAAPAIGQSCAMTFACADGAYCDESRTCAAQKGPGSACSYATSSECKSGYCSGGKCTAGVIASADLCSGTDTGGSSSSGGSSTPAVDAGH